MKIAILSNGPGNYSTKRLREVAKARGHTVLQAFYLTNEDGTNVLLQEFVKESAGMDIRAFVVGSRVVASMRRQSLDEVSAATCTRAVPVQQLN